MAERQIAFLLPVDGLPRAVFVTDYGLRQGRLIVDGSTVLEASSRESLTGGVSVTLPGTSRQITVRAIEDDLELSVDGIAAPREEDLHAPSSRSAWMHGWIALGGSAFGLIASYLYVLRAHALEDAWSMRMALHMAAWHLLLTLTLFPASVWGQRLGIRAVQATSLLFFLIHVGIAISNAHASGEIANGASIAFFNAASGIMFLVAVAYGQRAHADMDPICAARLNEDGQCFLDDHDQ
jgi:hypothetical protein